VAASASAVGIADGVAGGSNGALAACSTMSHGIAPGTCEAGTGIGEAGSARQHAWVVTRAWPRRGTHVVSMQSWPLMSSASDASTADRHVVPDLIASSSACG
jgi:hypothetical protein